MEHLATYTDAYMQYQASDMQLHIDTDTSYLVLTKNAVESQVSII